MSQCDTCRCATTLILVSQLALCFVRVARLKRIAGKNQPKILYAVGQSEIHEIRFGCPYGNLCEICAKVFAGIVQIARKTCSQLRSMFPA